MSYQSDMAKWLSRIGIVIALVGFTLYVIAKIRLLTPYGPSGAHLNKERYPFALVIAGIGAILWILTRVINHLHHNQHTED